MKIFFTSLILKFVIFLTVDSKQEEKIDFDSNGYVIFCLCMGRFGNQAGKYNNNKKYFCLRNKNDYKKTKSFLEHFLGSMSFAKNINRTLVVPPFITYKNIPFKEWFKLEKLNEFHRSISAEDFMKLIAPDYWPIGKRYGFCWLPASSPQQVCEMKNGNPSTSFWNELGVEKFDDNIVYDISFYDYPKWAEKFPAEKYPVIALKGAPATFPMFKEDRKNQKFLEWSDQMNENVQDYINKTFGLNKFIGIHLRNGPDWENACAQLDKYEFDYYMASPQCLENRGQKVTRNICLPSKKRILQDLENVLATYNNEIKHIYVATDKSPMINEIKSHFKEKIKDLVVVHQDPWLPVIDLAVLAQSEHFIGNCVSSFTSFVKRERDILNRPSSFWAFDG